MQKLTALSKLLIAGILVGSGVTAYRTYGGMVRASVQHHSLPSTVAVAAARPDVLLPPAAAAPSASAAAAPAAASRPVRVGLSQWPGHMGFVLAAGGLRTQPGSLADKDGLDLEVVFIEDAPSKNKALQAGEVDFVWQTIDELPIAMASYREKNVEARILLQLDWSRGGDACVATKEIQKVEDLIGKRTAVMMFSPDHTLFEFMITNSRLTREQAADVRKSIKFSLDDPMYARTLFEKKEVEVACLWEPDVTLALGSRPGAHRLFSTEDATELVADVLMARRDFLDAHQDVAQKVVRAWFAGADLGNKDKPAAAKVISTVAKRFREELGYDKTLLGLDWVKWTTLADNVKLFGVDGGAPAFDRVYNQADGIWISYPEAEIKDRFAPAALRDDRAVRAVWESAGKPIAKTEEKFQQEEARTGAALFTKPISINFDTGSSTLSAEAISLLNQQVLPQLLIAGGMYARIEGNTDSIGDYAMNQALSEQRAAAIVSYLVSRGIPAARLVSRGNGSSAPIATNKTADGRALNRRTDVLFIRRTKA